MTVELIKIVDAVPSQHAWFTITTLPDGWTHVETIIPRSGAPGEDVRSALFLCAQDAEAHVYRTCVAHFGRFSDAELAGSALTWKIAAYRNTPQPCLDLATSIAEAISDRLEEESGEAGGQPATFEPVRWCDCTSEVWETDD